MATIRQRAPASWHAQVRIKNPRGETVSRTRTFDTEREAAAWAAVTEEKIAAGIEENQKLERETLLDDLLERYARDVMPKKKSGMKEVNRINKWRSHHLAKLSILAIGPSEITEYREARIKAGDAASTIRNNINHLSRVFNIARTEWGYKISNPCAGVARPKLPPGRDVVLSRDDEMRLFEYLENDIVYHKYLKYIVKIALTTAMRAGEIRQLTWGDLRDGYIFVPADRAKNGESRNVHLFKEGLDFITNFVSTQKPKRAKPADRIFPAEATEDAVTHAFIVAVQKTKIKHLRLHDLRHTAITRHAPYFTSAVEMCRWTGHKTPSMLLRYFNPDPVEYGSILRMREREHAQRMAVEKKEV